MLFAPIFSIVYLLHLTLLRLPYYWDEGGYYIPAAWDFWRLGTLIPRTTMSNAHPPLPGILLAGWWSLTGFHVYSTRLLMCLVASTALLGVYRFARTLGGQAVATTVCLLCAIYPVWFAQSTLAHADLFAAAATVWALSYYVDRPEWTPGQAMTARSRALRVGACFSLAVLCKETAIVTPAALFCLEAWWSWQAGRSEGQKAAPRYAASHVPLLCGLAAPVLPLVAWYAYHRLKTGFIFGNPEYLRYNATANLSILRVMLSMWHRLIHLTVHMNLFVPVLLTVAVFLLPPRFGERRLPRRAGIALVWVLASHWIAFSVLGGALLTRYLLPAYPVILLLCVTAWKQRVVQWQVLSALTLVAFAVGCRVNPPYPFAPEDNLAYRDMIVLHEQAIQKVQNHRPAATVLSAWPVTADLQRPELGYVKQPIRTVEIPNFTGQQVALAAQRPSDYDTAIVFSTKYNPAPSRLNLARSSEWDARYFDAHRDLLPDELASRLGGTVAWQAERNGQWAAVLRFDRSYDALWEDHRCLGR